MSKTKWIEKGRALAIKKQPHNPSVHDEYDNQRFQLITETANEIRPYFDESNMHDYTDGSSDGDSENNSTDKDKETGDIKPKGSNRLLRTATEIMETWYLRNIDNPYPGSDKRKLAKEAGITEKQVLKWFSNRRTRDKMTRKRNQPW